ncbi:hypothetical protein K2X85_15980 [bacterium]|nr:hypothetical protein [bacterium]
MLRLTLRTLLAYLDDTLPPAESRHIGQQIAEEPAINDLVTRIQNVMRRTKLLADSADPDHAEVDPNDVAEYLDNVLTPSRVADLEKRLLEHDSELAEAASVHQILSLVLGKPTEIPASARERAYNLVRGRRTSHIELEPIGPVRPGINTGGSPSPIGPRGEPIDPPKTFSFATAGLVAGLLGLLGVTVYLTVSGQKERPMPPLAKRENELPPAPVPPSNPIASTPTASTTTDPVPSPISAALPADSPAIASARETRPGDSIIPEPVPDPPVGIAPKSPLADPDGKSSSPEESETGPVIALPKDELDPVPGVDNDRESTTLAKTPEENPLSKESADAPLKQEPSASEKPSEDRPADPVVRPVPVATYTSQAGILLRLSEGKWTRLMPRAKLQSGEVIAYAEPSRAKIELPTGVTIELVGPTRLNLRFDPTVDFSFDLLEGRLLLRGSGEPASIQFHVGSTVGTLLLDGPEKIVTAEHRLFGPPKNASPNGIIHEVDLTAMVGAVEWQQGGEDVAVAAGEQIVIRSDEANPPTPSSASKPAWADPSADGAGEKILGRLSDEVSLTGNPAEKFRELIDDNNKDIRVLAVDALAMMRQVDALVEAIRDPKHEAVRRRSLLALRTMVRERGESYALVKSTLDKTFGPDSVPLMGLLDFRNSAMSKPRVSFQAWIEQLDSSELCIREAAISQLVDMTGRDLGFSAEGTGAQRNVSISKWNKWLDSQNDEQLIKLIASSP